MERKKELRYDTIEKESTKIGDGEKERATMR